MIYIKKTPFFLFLLALSHTDDALVTASPKFQVRRVQIRLESSVYYNIHIIQYRFNISSFCICSNVYPV